MTSRTRWPEVTDRLTKKPFDCEGVFFFGCGADSALLRLDEASAAFLEAHPEEVREAQERRLAEWPGSIVELPRTGDGYARFAAGCHVGGYVAIVTKTVLAGTGMPAASCPFVEYYLASLHSVLAALLPSGPLASPPGATPSEQESYVATEPADSRLLGDLWREHYGKDKWLAVKQGQVRAWGKTREEVERLLEEGNVAPPVGKQRRLSSRPGFRSGACASTRTAISSSSPEARWTTRFAWRQ